MKLKYSKVVKKKNFLELRSGKTGRGKLIDRVYCDLSLPGASDLLDYANRKLCLIAREHGYYFSDYKIEEK